MALLAHDRRTLQGAAASAVPHRCRLQADRTEFFAAQDSISFTHAGAPELVQIMDGDREAKACEPLSQATTFYSPEQGPRLLDLVVSSCGSVH